jgi:soluble lytic murein transglycosylase
VGWTQWQVMRMKTFTPLHAFSHKILPLLGWATLAFSLIASPLAAQTADTMRAALQASAAKDWARAMSLVPPGAARDVIEWQKLRASDGLLGEYESFLKRNADWPGLELLHQRGEEAVARSTTPDRVVQYFATDKASTAKGAIALVRALMAAGQNDLAKAEAGRAWVNLRFGASDEAELLALQGSALASLNEARLDELLWDGREAEAKRMLPRVSQGWQALGQARLALRAMSGDENALIAAVPKALADDPGMAYERFVWRMRKGFTDGALELVLARSGSVASLGRPGEWARRRTELTRDLMSEARAREAYRVAAAHHLEGGGDYAELEFLAGYIALRKLDDGATARGHFQHLQAGVSTPISLSRAHYWEGRAEEALRNSEAAKRAFEAGAAHQTAYYGLLSAEKLGLTLDNALLSEARGADWQSAAFASSSVLQAGRLLLAAGDRNLGKRFLLHLAEGLNAAELAQLADMALDMDEPHVAVLIGKQAAGRGIILSRSYFPVVGMVPQTLPVSRALALSIARRESEFDPVVISPAGARGLMQVMPGTAKAMAVETAQDYALARLTSDPAYNISLGAAYLAVLVKEFGPSVALVASGYNAGPGRPRRWIGEFGDPRLPQVDVVDWVETIPFSETRTYVMRVVESLVIYRAKLRGSPGLVNVTSELTGR